MDTVSVPAWRKSSKCANATCVEVAGGDNGALVRDSKNLDSPILSFNLKAWAQFLDGVRGGEFDRS